MRSGFIHTIALGSLPRVVNKAMNEKTDYIAIERSAAGRQGETDRHLLTSEVLLTYNANPGITIRTIFYMIEPQV